MNREELEHVIRASADLTNEYEFVIVGSQAILGPIPNPPAVFTMSAEVDIYPLQRPELADRIDGNLGEGSHFHRSFGYYAQGVGPKTAVLPLGWMTRVHRVQNMATGGRVGYCLDPLDLFLSKAVAGREKDRIFCKAMLQHRYVTAKDLLALVGTMPIDEAAQRRLKATIRRWSESVQTEGQPPPGV
ncbi:MAG TPA: hypothetical protein PKJ45_02625 [Rubrivivax sp.]|nr:hypothetical protein [Rubrivivax sp.]